VSWLLQTDPNRRPSIEQVLSHPAIVGKVQEFQMLYPASLPKRPRQRFGQKPEEPALPVNEKRVSMMKEIKNKPKINMRPTGHPNSLVSLDQLKEKQKKASLINEAKSRESKREKYPSSMSQLEHKKNNQNNKIKVSIGEIGQIKANIRTQNAETPRPNFSSKNSQRKSEPRDIISNNKCFMKKNEDNQDQKTTEIVNHNEEKQNIDINESISSRKERITQLLARYGKNKEGEYKGK
jgi:hypothetical protein